jgi:Protein of unknown function (DUF1579)
VRRAIQALVVVAISTAGSLAAQPKPAPKPTAEHQKLSYFVGSWTSSGEMKPSPFGPGGKITATETCEWFDGRFAVVCRSQGTSPMGPTKGIGFMGYNTEEKVYTYYGVDNSPMNMASVPKGTITGQTWTYNDEAMMGGKKIKSRFVLNITSPTSYTFKWETEEAPGKWAPIMEGTATKKGT